MDRGQSKITGDDPVVPIRFEMAKKAVHPLRGEIGQSELGHALVRIVGSKLEEELEGVAIRQNRVATQSALGHEMLVEKTADQSWEVGG